MLLDGDCRRALGWDDLASARRYIWQCLKTVFVVIMEGREDAISISWVETTYANILQCPGQPPNDKKLSSPRVLLVQRLRNPTVCSE